MSRVTAVVLLRIRQLSKEIPSAHKGAILYKVTIMAQFRLEPLLFTSPGRLTRFEDYAKLFHFLIFLFECACGHRIKSNKVFLHIGLFRRPMYEYDS